MITSSRESIANFIKMKQTETVRILCTGSKINSNGARMQLAGRICTALNPHMVDHGLTSIRCLLFSKCTILGQKFFIMMRNFLDGKFRSFDFQINLVATSLLNIS